MYYFNRFRFITWDHNLAFGSTVWTFNANNAAQWNIFDPTSGYRPLIERVLEVPEWNEEYLEKVDEFLEGPFSKEKLDPRIAALRARIRPYVLGTTGDKAPYTVLTSPDHFDRGMKEKLSPVDWRPVPGLEAFIEDRRDYLHSVLD